MTEDDIIDVLETLERFFAKFEQGSMSPVQWADAIDRAKLEGVISDIDGESVQFLQRRFGGHGGAVREWLLFNEMDFDLPREEGAPAPRRLEHRAEAARARGDDAMADMLTERASRADVRRSRNAQRKLEKLKAKGQRIIGEATK